ncbi:MAG: phosphoribosylformylglycinamidine synthase subunit PurS [Leptospirales bacterium]
MRFKGNVIVRFKKSVLEPQGKAIELSLKEREYTDVEQIRVGKHIETVVNAASKEEAQKKIEKIAESGLYNPVMEVCHIEMEELDETV